MEYLLTGKEITPEAADEMGLVAEVTLDPTEAALECAARLRDLPAEAVWRTKDLADPSLCFEEYCRRAIDNQWACVNDAEHKEAVRAFREDREPSVDR
jgi:2-(1,2-epoxy-1,2-dihydrophenyl)acetyl-CoA isomerase